MTFFSSLFPKIGKILKGIPILGMNLQNLRVKLKTPNFKHAWRSMAGKPFLQESFVLFFTNILLSSLINK